MTPTPERLRTLRSTLDRRQPDLTLVMDQVHKAHNFSAILRNCDAVGVMEAHAVKPGRGRFRIHNHTSGGTARWVEVRAHDKVASALDGLRARGFRLLAAHLSPRAQDYRQVDFTLPTALVVGAELHGVSDAALALVDGEVTIPMKGMARSLNVSVATAVLLFEAMRQREEAGMYRRSRLDPGTHRRTLFRWAHPRVAQWCDEEGFPYPEMDEGGEILGDWPARGAGGFSGVRG